MASGYTAMIGEADIWRSAAPIIKRYGDDVPLWAAIRAAGGNRAANRPAERGGASSTRCPALSPAPVTLC